MRVSSILFSALCQERIENRSASCSHKEGSHGTVAVTRPGLRPQDTLECTFAMRHLLHTCSPVTGANSSPASSRNVAMMVAYVRSGWKEVSFQDTALGAGRLNMIAEVGNLVKFTLRGKEEEGRRLGQGYIYTAEKGQKR